MTNAELKRDILAALSALNEAPRPEAEVSGRPPEGACCAS